MVTLAPKTGFSMRLKGEKGGEATLLKHAAPLPYPAPPPHLIGTMTIDRSHA